MTRDGALPEPAGAGDFTQAGTLLTVAAGATASTGEVTVTAVGNHVDAPDKQVSVTGTAQNGQADDDGETVAVTGATLTIEDDDEKGLAFEPAELFAVAAGGSATYTVALTSQPSGAVTVAVSTGNESVTVSSGSLTFTATDWNEAQTVTVSAGADDGDGYAHAAAPLTHRATGGGYDDVAGTEPGRMVASLPGNSPFATGYADTTPEFVDAAAFEDAFVWEVDEPIEPPVTLPAVKEGTGDGEIRYTLTPETLPPGVSYERASRRLSGTPTEEFARRSYTWTAEDADEETVALTFSIEVEPVRAKARARLKRINESILPELSRASQQFPLSSKVPVESPRSGAQTAEKAAKFRLHHHIQDVSGNCCVRRGTARWRRWRGGWRLRQAEAVRGRRAGGWPRRWWGSRGRTNRPWKRTPRGRSC